MMEESSLSYWIVTLMLVLMSDLRHVEAKKMDQEPMRCGVSDMPKVEELKLFTPGTYTTRSSNSRSERNTWHQMKFEVHYDETVTSSSQRDLIMNITQESVDLISRQLEVREAPADIILSRSCDTGSYVNNGTLYNCTCSRPTCAYIQIPEKHLKPCLDCKFYENGTEYDCEPQPGGPASRGAIGVHYILYVISIACPTGIVGFASACYLDTTYNRPNVGFINFCPDFLDILGAPLLQTTAQHEINHALGLGSGFFAFYRDENGDPLTPLGENGFPLERHPDRNLFQWSDQVVRTQTLEWDVRGGTIERNVSIMVTPNLIREARDFYGCDTIEGVELEDDYGRIPSGSALNHFEFRLMPTESMSPVITFSRRAFSRFTLAFFEDTGWYRANYDLADPYEYGRNLGCGYVQKSCKWWMDTQRQRKESLSPYCENPLELVCSVEGDAPAQCTNNIHDEPLPPQYQFFDSFLDFNYTELGKVGGYADFADHCPFIYPGYPIQTNDYKRQTCDKEIDECASNPCGNGATCSDIITGYFCTCAAGYEGRHCIHEKTTCMTSEECTQNEMCMDGLCSCGYGRIRNDGACLIPRRFSMALQLTEVNGSLATYPDILNSDETAIRREIEYAVFLRLSRWEIFVESIFSVDVTSFFNGSLWVGVHVILEPDSSPNDVTINTLMSDTYFYDSRALSSANTVFTLNNLTVQDLDECNMTAYSTCSVYSTCNNTLGSYQCTCLPGFVDQGDVIDGPGTVCIDIDECSNSSLNDCSQFSQCNNTTGDYDCTCLSGYVDNGPVNGRSGVSCTDIDECISNPCLNGGACWNFKDRFTCECPSGYEGRFCETAIPSCTSEDLCSQIDHEFCDTSGLCNCRPGYLRQNGICQAIATYTGSLSFTSLNGQPLVYTSGLAHSSRPAFNQLAQQFRGAIMSVIPEILDVSITSFRSGSIIAEFNLFVTDGTSKAAVTTAIMTGIGDGTLLVGEDIVDVVPSSMSIADLDECIFGELNDCSPVAECTNMDGTFSCTCPSGFIDTSPTGAGLGKECTAEEVPDDSGRNSTSIIIILAIVLCVVFIFIASMVAILICCRLSAKELKEKRERRQNDDDDIIYANPDTRLRAHLQHESNLPVYGFDNHLDHAYPISFREARGHRTRHDRPMYHYDPDRRDQLRTVSNAILGYDQRIDPRFDRGFGPGNGQLRLEYPLHQRSSSPTRYMNGAQSNLKALPY